MYYYSGIFYSDTDIKLGYQVKQTCIKHNINIIYEDDYYSLIYKIVSARPEIIFIDSKKSLSDFQLENLINNPCNTKVVILENEISSNYNIEKVNIKDLNEYLKCYDVLDLKSDKIFSSSYERNINDLFNKLGISRKFRGSEYLFECINLVLKDKNYFKCLHKNCYPVVSAKYNTELKNIERNIRHSIELAWANRDEKAWESCFKGYVFTSKPTNRNFIVLCADAIKRGIN